MLGKTPCAIKHRANRIGCYKNRLSELFISPLDGEEWRDVVGYEGLYQVSNHGRIRTTRKNGSDGRNLKSVIMRPYTDEDGYKRVTLTRGRNPIQYSVHRLVAIAFIENPHSLPVINHKDCNPSNNHASNLEWCTTQYNVNYGDRAEKYSKKTRGENHYNNILAEEDVLFIRANYIPSDACFGQAALARKYGVTRGTIESIVRNKSWKHLIKEGTA